MVVRRSGGFSSLTQPRRSASSSQRRQTVCSLPGPSDRQWPKDSPRSMLLAQSAHATMPKGTTAT